MGAGLDTELLPMRVALGLLMVGHGTRKLSG